MALPTASSLWQALESRSEATLALTGLVLTGSIFVTLAALRAVIQWQLGSPIVATFAECLLIAGPGIALVYGAYSLHHSSIESRCYRLVTERVILAIGVILVILAAYDYLTVDGLQDPLTSIPILTALSSLAGYGIGRYQARVETQIEALERHRCSLERERDFVDRIYETSPVGILVLTPDGSIVSVNSRATEMLDHSRSAMLDGSIQTIFTQESEQLQDCVHEVLAGNELHGREVDLGKSDGKGRWLNVNGRAVRDRDGEIEDVILTLEDITHRKRKERQLEVYQTVAETVTDAWVTVDESGTITMANPAVESLFGYEPAGLKGQDVTQLIPPRYRDGHTRGFEQFLDTETRTMAWEDIELLGLHKSGDEIPLSMALNDFQRQGRRYFTGVFRDISDRKQLEAALRSERDIRQRIFETNPTGILVTDKSGTIRFVNDRASELFGVPIEPEATFDELRSRVAFRKPSGEPIEDSEALRVMEYGEPCYNEERLITTPAGQDRYLSVNCGPLHTRDGEIRGKVVSFEEITERKQYEARLVSITELMSELESAETPQEVARTVMETAASVMDVEVAKIALLDETADHLETIAATPAGREISDTGPVFNLETGVPWQVYSEQREYIEPSLSADATQEQTAMESVMLFPLGEYGVFVAGSTSETAFSEIECSLARILADYTRATLTRVDRETTIREQRDQLERQNEALERVRLINATIRGIMRDVIQSSNRGEIFEAVCDRLERIGLVEFVWIGGYDQATDSLDLEAMCGIRQSTVEELRTTTSNDPEASIPARQAIEAGQPVTENALMGDPPFEQWQQLAIDLGCRSYIAVPIQFRDRLFGVLTIYGSAGNIFTEREEAVLVELGELVGYAVHAAAQREALIDESSVELEFHVEHGTNPLFELVHEHDCDLEFETIRQNSNGQTCVFVTLYGIDRTAIEGRPQSSTLLEVISARENEILVEARFNEPNLFADLVEFGAMPRRYRTNDTTGAAVFRIPQSSEIRDVIHVLENYFDGVELVARRELEKPVRTTAAFETELRSRLTERQEEILQTAYLAGYFESPRSISAQELGDRIGVTQPTISRHIRAGERELFGLLFDSIGEED